MEHKTELCKVLGLPADTADEKIAEAIEAVNREAADIEAATKENDDSPELTEARNRIAELEAKVAEAEATRFDDLFEGDEAKKALRTVIAMNREAAVTLLSGFKAPAAKKVIPVPVYNRNVQPVPSVNEDAENAKAERIQARATELVALNRQRGRSMTFMQAFSQATAESSGIDPNVNLKRPIEKNGA